MFKLDLEMLYPGVGPTSLYPDVHKMALCTLHFEMRAGERIIWELLSYPLKHKLGPGGGKGRVVEAVKVLPRRLMMMMSSHRLTDRSLSRQAIRDAMKWKHFNVKWAPKSKYTALMRLSLSRKHAKIIVGVLAEHALPVLVKEDDPVLASGARPLDQWKMALESYVEAVKMMRKVPGDDEYSMGDAGFEEQLERDASQLQFHADRSSKALISVCTDKVLTNYLHCLHSGIVL